jgi:hypothetical protein
MVIQHMDTIVNISQWLAMAVTLWASWLVSSKSKHCRNWGFWLFTLGNFLWVFWGWHTQAYALIALQFGLFFLNIRGVRNNESS